MKPPHPPPRYEDAWRALGDDAEALPLKVETRSARPAARSRDSRATRATPRGGARRRARRARARRAAERRLLGGLATETRSRPTTRRATWRAGTSASSTRTRSARSPTRSTARSRKSSTCSSRGARRRPPRPSAAREGARARASARGRKRGGPFNEEERTLGSEARRNRCPGMQHTKGGGGRGAGAARPVERARVARARARARARFGARYHVACTKKSKSESARMCFCSMYAPTAPATSKRFAYHGGERAALVRSSGRMPSAGLAVKTRERRDRPCPCSKVQRREHEPTKPASTSASWSRSLSRSFSFEKKVAAGTRPGCPPSAPACSS